MSRSPLLEELNQPIPRRTKIKKSFMIMVLCITLAFPGIGIYFTYTTYKMCRDHEILKENGIATEAQVINLKIGHSKSSQYYKVTYAFHFQKDSGNQIATRQTTKTIFEQLRTGQNVPILYDPLDPERSDLNFNDVVHTSDPYASLPTILWIIWPMFGGSYLFVMLCIGISHFKDKQLVRYGLAAPATILETNEVQGRRPSISVTYQFIDKQGETIQGVQKGLPTKAQRKSKRFQSYWDDIMTRPIALYDPQDNSKNMLYGSGSVLCYSPNRSS